MVIPFKATIKGWKDSRFLAIRAVYHSSRLAWLCCRLLADPRLRSETFGPWWHRGYYHQRVTKTCANRYPELFEECRRHCAQNVRPKLLSFGCSTGEEVFSLAEFLPQALIVGVEINNWCLAQCRRKDPQHRHMFHHRRSTGFAQAQDFDVICCLAVFQRTENRNTDDNAVVLGHTFEQFEREILLLHDKLKPGGLFLIDHADFRFTDTACAASYTPLDFPGNRILRTRPLYGRDNRKLADQHDSLRVFLKNA